MGVANALQENTGCCHAGLHQPGKRLHTPAGVRARAEQSEQAPGNICRAPLPTYRCSAAGSSRITPQNRAVAAAGHTGNTHRWANTDVIDLITRSLAASSSSLQLGRISH